MTLYSVSQITKHIKDIFDSDEVLADLWVKGEVSNLSHSAAGHFYFTLKDATNQIKCVMFRPAYGNEHLMNGASVSVHGYCRGSLQNERRQRPGVVAGVGGSIGSGDFVDRDAARHVARASA